MNAFNFIHHPIDHKTILLRVDFNVPIHDQTILDPSRIDATLPTLHKLIERNCKIVIISHLGKPKGKKNLTDSLKPCALYLQKKISTPVFFCDDCIGANAKTVVEHLKEKEIVVLENLRFHLEEEHPTEPNFFAKELASFADFYIDDAFGAAHRNHSSITSICHYFPNRAFFGLLMLKEIEILSHLYTHPKKPYLAILGGAKIESKIGVIASLLPRIDQLVIVGGMAIPFFNAEKKAIDSPLLSIDAIESAQKILIEAKKQGVPILLPEDLLYSESLEKPLNTETLDTTVPSSSPKIPVDIGPKTIKKIISLLSHPYQTIFWNGPAGVFEVKPFDQGTFAIAKALSSLKADTIVGGGDSVSAIKNFGLNEKNFYHLSTGGGASLEFLEAGTLVGIEAVKNSLVHLF